MKSFSAILPIIALAQGAAMMVISQGSAIAVSYPEPFPNTINSVFGPRGDASPIHTGIDYKQPKDASIPAASSGYVDAIKSDNNFCGERLYLMTDDKKLIGYCHLFSKTAAQTYTGGDFTLIKNYQSSIKTIGLRSNATNSNCNLILANKTKVALVQKSCAFGTLAVGKIIYPFTNSKVAYTVANKITANQLIAPVGNSSGSGPKIGFHLHINYNNGVDNPLQVVTHPNGVFCPRLMDAGNSTSACDPVASNPVIQQSLLSSRKYIDVRVDSTGRLDLDQAQFNISTSPVQSFSLQYGGTDTTSPQVNGLNVNGLNKSPKLLSIAVDQNQACLKIPATGEVIICPLIWDGQKIPPIQTPPLETKFRLGIDANAFTPGNYHVDMILTSVTGVATTFSLPFTVNSGIPTATLLVPDLQANWGGLPATISLTNLVTASVQSFQSFGNSSTCGTGERGTPLYSNVVPAGATFYAAPTVTGMPFQFGGPGINRNNCSSFVAVKMIPNPVNAAQMKQRIWINGTGRGQQFGTFILDWEYQVRFDSGDPWSGIGRSCVGGTVANSGFFGAAWSSTNCSASLNF